MNRMQRILIAACSLGLTTTAWAATTSSADSSYLKRTAPRFESFAGSSDNYSSLATGLRSGKPITLTGSGEKATFTSPTKPMGYGNITRSLDLAQRQLALQGITDPTPSQLQTALMGGTITTSKGTVVYKGVLQMRADGMGWGQIAHSVGLHPGLGKGPTMAATSSTGITTATGGQSAAATGKSHRPDTAGATGKGQASIATASGGGGNSAAAHANARGLGNSAAITSAGGANAGGTASAAGGGNGNAFGRGK
jgi:hypothetical protein